MDKVTKKAKQYCKENIPNLPDMHLAIETAFEAGWRAAYEHLIHIPWDKAVKELSDYIDEKEGK